MTAATVAPARPVVTIGVDTHSDVHVAVALDQLGRRLAELSVDTTPEGYRLLERWAGSVKVNWPRGDTTGPGGASQR